MIDTSKATVHLVEDDDRVRRALRRLIEAAGHRVEGHASAEAFLAAWDPAASGCAVVDLTLPGVDGLRLQARIEAEAAGYPVIFLTGTGDIEKSVAAMKGGAVDFLTKPVDGARLCDAIEVGLARGAAVHDDRLAAKRFEENLARLTARETEVLECVVEGLLNKQIADRLGMAEKTVKIHRGRVMQKLGARTVGQLVGLVVHFRSRT